MNPIKNIWQVLPPQWRIPVQRSAYFLLGSGLTLFYAQLVQAQTNPSSPPVRTAYSLETIVAAIFGAIITVLFLRAMYLVLTYASQTYGLEEEENIDTSDENPTLIWGAVGWSVGSALIIASYGWGWGFLYLGPIICLLGPLVPIVAMELDLKNYRAILSDRSRNVSSRRF
jgi:cell division protein FtsX